MAYDSSVKIVAQSGVPVGIPGSGSIGVNGALTLTTAMALTYSNIWLYFPAGAVYTNSAAGCYFCQMTSTTAGTVYNNILTGVPFVPTVVNPIVSAAVGSYTAPTTIQTLFATTMPGGSMGANGQLFLYSDYTYANSANNKTFTATLGGQNLWSFSASTTLSSNAIKWLANRGDTQKQFLRPAAQTGFSQAAGSPVQYSLNTETNLALIFSGTLANAADYIVLEDCTIQAIFKG